MTKKIYTNSLFSLFLLFLAFNIQAQDGDDIEFVEKRDVGTGVFLKWEMPDDESIQQFFLERATADSEFEVVLKLVLFTLK